MNTFVTHPSIRIKGTENNYEPVLCMDTNCINKNPHMHCPFCLKSEAFLDPVILKAHYRVKHVDKGIEFAGLKVLRCCDHCDIVGSIKGAKEFRGAHWHCYRCRNGFNRRDEAIKHFRTHFRNPQTTFQIQVNEEVNQTFNMSNDMDDNGDVLTDFGGPIISDSGDTEQDVILATTPLGAPFSGSCTSAALTNGKQHEVVSVAANETVGTTDETHGIMIIETADLDESQLTENGSQPLQSDLSSGIWLEKQAELEKRVNELIEENLQLALAKNEMEQQMHTELHKLQLQLAGQAQEMAHLEKREQELLEQLSIPISGSMQQLLTKMAGDHEDLLHQQLAFLRRGYLQTPFIASPPGAPVSSPDGDTGTLDIPTDGYMDGSGDKVAPSVDGGETKLTDGCTQMPPDLGGKKRSRETECKDEERGKLKKES